MEKNAKTALIILPLFRSPDIYFELKGYMKIANQLKAAGYERVVVISPWQDLDADFPVISRELQGQGAEYAYFGKVSGLKLKVKDFGGSRFVRMGNAIKDYILKKGCDLLVAGVEGAAGFIVLQALRTGVFSNPFPFITFARTPFAWNNENRRNWFNNGQEDTKLNWAENYLMANANLTVFESECLEKEFRRQTPDWAGETKVWSVINAGLGTTRLKTGTDLLIHLDGSLTENAFILDDWFVAAARDSKNKLSQYPKIHVIYDWQSPEMRQVERKYKNLGGKEIGFYFSENQKKTKELLESISPATVILLENPVHNSPYLLAGRDSKISFLAPDNGNASEWIAKAGLVEPKGGKIFQQINSPPEKPAHEPGLVSGLSNDFPLTPAYFENPNGTGPEQSPKTEPNVSICIAYFNYGQYLPDLLTSLEAQDYPDFEVIVVNDGSTEEDSNRVFDNLAKKYADKPWKFLKKQNGGIGHTRNFASHQAEGKYIIFMDADNLAREGMISNFVRAIETSGSDLVTCHLTAFENQTQIDNDDPAFFYRPIGPCLEVGFLENVFGDANFIVRREALLNVGGFGEDRSTSFEDWELMAKMALKGFRLEVMPAPAFWYRYLEGGFSRVTNQFANQRRVIKAYEEYLPGFGKNILTQLTYPLWIQNREKGRLLDSVYGRIIKKFAKVGNRMFPSDSPHYKLARRIVRKIL